MKQYFFIRPAPGRLVRDPGSKVPLPVTGARKWRSTYWLRRVRGGDVLAGPSDAHKYLRHARGGDENDLLVAGDGKKYRLVPVERVNVVVLSPVTENGAMVTGGGQ